MKRKLFFCVFICLLKSIFSFGQEISKPPLDMDKIDLSKTVNTDQAAKWVKHYKKKKWRKHNKRFPVVGEKYDARTCWFSIDSIRNFIKYLDDLENSGKIKDVDGIRFYYIAYKKEDSVYHHEPAYKNAHSLLWVATEKILVPENERPTPKDSVYHKDLLLEKKGKRVTIASTMMNTGTLCPPLPPRSCKGSLLLAEADKKRR